jgi:hypothetical protein
LALDQNFYNFWHWIIGFNNGIFGLFSTFDLVPKSVRTTLNTSSKVLKAKNTIIRTFDLVPKVGRTDFGTRSKV